MGAQQEKSEQVAFTAKSIGTMRTGSNDPPRQSTVSDLEGTLEINREYLDGLKDIKPGDRIVVLFHFDRSPQFSNNFLIQTPPHRQGERLGVFSTRSPIRPNPIGMSVYNVLWVRENILGVRGVDVFDGTPILDIKPYIKEE